MIIFNGNSWTFYVKKDQIVVCYVVTCRKGVLGRSFLLPEDRLGRMTLRS